MSVEPVVRRMTAVDVDLCRSIEGDARRHLLDQRGGRAWLAEHPELPSGWSDWPAVSLVATIDEAVVGLLVATIDDEPGRGRIMRIDRVHVVPEARGIGCGDALLDAAFAAADGCAYLEATVLPGDRETKNLYERAGVTARAIVVSRELD